jgi:hypothetical protein
MSTYGIFKNKDKKTLVFYPCPKNANSSAKLFFIKHLGLEKEYIFLGDKIPRFKQTNIDFGLKKNIINFLPTKQPFKEIDANIKCCIVRNPIERFVSCYKNRILFHKDVDFLDHSIDMILSKLEDSMFENKHFLPQSYFLGNALEYFDFYSDVNNIKLFQDGVNDFFCKKIIFPKIQTGGNKNNIFLDKLQIQKIKKIYFSDYNLIG